MVREGGYSGFQHENVPVGPPPKLRETDNSPAPGAFNSFRSESRRTLQAPGPLEFGAGYLLALHRDELEVERVVMYELVTPGA